MTDTVCEAKQHSDQMVCAKCQLTWDMNDPHPPDCRQMTDTENLLKRLETDTKGSRELDARIHWEVVKNDPQPFEGWCTGVDMWLEGAEKNGNTSHLYTTSLDAKLPWENITSMEKFLSGRFRAVNNYQNIGIGRTEALARRAAALKGRP